MEYIYSAMVLHSAGKPVTEEGIANILKAVGIDPDTSRIKALTASLEGVNIDEAISTAVSVPAAPVPSAPGAPAEEKEEKKPEKKEEKKKIEEKVSEEEAAAGLGALFG